MRSEDTIEAILEDCTINPIYYLAKRGIKAREMELTLTFATHLVGRAINVAQGLHWHNTGGFMPGDVVVSTYAPTRACEVIGFAKDHEGHDCLVTYLEGTLMVVMIAVEDAMRYVVPSMEKIRKEMELSLLEAHDDAEAECIAGNLIDMMHHSFDGRRYPVRPGGAL